MFRNNNPEVGSRPGTLAIPENSPEPRIRVTQYSADDVEVIDIDDVATLPGLVKSDYVTWVDIQGFGNEAKLRGLAAAFRLHPIALEHAVNVPQREAINAMLRPQSPFFSDNVQLFVRDTRDHISQIVELVDSSREMGSDLADAYLLNVSHRSNEIMKVLTLMASIFIPLTFIAGVYGMNFDYIPELSNPVGYFIVWGVMIATAIFMIFFFRRRGWIGTSKPPPADW